MLMGGKRIYVPSLCPYVFSMPFVFLPMQVFNRAAYVSVDVVKAKGSGRLQFSRQPLTHWSFAFYEVGTN